MHILKHVLMLMTRRHLSNLSLYNVYLGFKVKRTVIIVWEKMLKSLDKMEESTK